MRLMWLKTLLNWLLSLLPNRDWALKRHDFSFHLENRSLLINSAIYLDLKIQLPSAWQLNNLSIHPGCHSLRTNSQTQFFFILDTFFPSPSLIRSSSNVLLIQIIETIAFVYDVYSESRVNMMPLRCFDSTLLDSKAFRMKLFLLILQFSSHFMYSFLHIHRIQFRQARPIDPLITFRSDKGPSSLFYMLWPGWTSITFNSSQRHSSIIIHILIRKTSFEFIISFHSIHHLLWVVFP